MIFQDPLSSLNPVHRIGTQIAEAMHAHFEVAHYEAKEEVETLLGRVGMPDPKRRARAYPHELSGGMRQRAMIAMAIANDPRLLIADEPTTALDVTIQAQVLDLLADLRRELRMALVFISHSLPVVAEIADRVLVMYAGEIVEQGSCATIFAAAAASVYRRAAAERAARRRNAAGRHPRRRAAAACDAAGLRLRAALPVARPRRAKRSVRRWSRSRAGRATRCLRWRELA